jgi:dTDP-4-amino-4,6-dideoxygalactose transaminase
MSAQGPHKVTADFEQAICDYTGAPFCVAVDSASSALALCLMCENVNGTQITIPNRTYMSVPCEIILAGAKVKWKMVEGNTITGAYQLAPTRIWDSALRFTADMYERHALMCLSFTGAFKHLKLGKGGAILCPYRMEYEWFKRARNSGRSECSYHTDEFTMLGRNCYMMPMIAAQGLLLMNQFYNLDGSKKAMPDLTIPYPDLSQFPVYSQ